MYSRCPRWKGWNLPWIIPRLMAGATLLDGQRDEKAAGRLRVVAEHDEAVGHAFQGQVPPGEVAVPRIAARANSLAREVESAVDGREPFGLEPDLDTASLGHLMHVTEE